MDTEHVQNIYILILHVYLFVRVCVSLSHLCVLHVLLVSLYVSLCLSMSRCVCVCVCVWVVYFAPSSSIILTTSFRNETSPRIICRFSELPVSLATSCIHVYACMDRSICVCVRMWVCIHVRVSGYTCVYEMSGCMCTYEDSQKYLENSG